MKKLHLTLLAALLFGVVPLAASAAGWTPSDPLMPTGDSTLDTENLQAALLDSRLDTGGTLYLGPGTFMIHRFIGRQDISDPSDPSYSIDLFNGTIQGAGKGVTILRGVRGPGGVSFEPLHYELPGFASDDHTLLGLVQVYLGVKDLTFDSEATLVDPNNANGNRGLINYLGTGSFEISLNELIGTDVTNVHFKGSLDSAGDPETSHLFQQWGDEGGVHNITNSEFENSSNGALQFFDLANATINIGGSPNDSVTIINAFLGGVQFGGCRNCTVNVSHLKTHDSAGVYFWPGWSNTYSTITVTHSEIRTKPDSSYAGIELWGRSGDISVLIEKNKIHNEDSFLWGPIFSDGAIQSGLIANNKITGRGPAAMYLEIDSWREGSVAIVGNNLNGWVTTADPWWLGTKPIWLGPFVVDSLVVGGYNHMNVFDEPAYDTSWNPLYDENGNPLTIPGYGDLIPPEEFGNLVPKNNTFTGVNNMHSNIGQDVREAMRQKVEVKQSLMSELHR